MHGHVADHGHPEVQQCLVLLLLMSVHEFMLCILKLEKTTIRERLYTCKPLGFGFQN